MAIRRPVPALAIALAVVLALAGLGLGVSHRLSPSIVVVAGTESSRAQHLTDAQFGPGVLVPILLEGPPAELDRQGPPSSERWTVAPMHASCRRGTAGAPARRCAPGRARR
jgi:hypothetical protein